jgi:quinol monooxygenase YgiN
VATIVILDIHTKSDRLEEMRNFLREALPVALSYEGSLGVEVIENLDVPGNIVFYEKWVSRKHYENYYAFRESTGVLEAFVDMLTKDPEIRYFDTYEM